MTLKKKLLVGLILICAVLLTACNIVESIDTTEQDQLMWQVLESTVAGEYDEIRDVFIDDISDQDFCDGMDQIRDYIEGDIVDYSKTGVYFNTNVTLGRKINTQDLTYIVNTTEQQYTVQMQLYRENDSDYKISIFNVSLSEEETEEDKINWVD